MWNASAYDISDLHDIRLQQHHKACRCTFALFCGNPLLVSVQQRKEEQERARKAVEEKSAQVKREKEALSKKQELETAQSAEEAQREKRKVEEGRQVRMCLYTCKFGTVIISPHSKFQGVRICFIHTSVEVGSTKHPASVNSSTFSTWRVM